MNPETSFQSSMVSTMQRRTRQKNKFEEVESSLPSLESSPEPSLSRLWRPSGFWGKLGRFMPVGRAVKKSNIVWLLDNTAFQHATHGHWCAEFIAAVFEREDKARLVDVVSGVAQAIGLADDAYERKTVEERVLPFLWDVRPATTVSALHQGTQLKIGPSDANGLCSNVLTISGSAEGSLVRTTAKHNRGGGGGAIPHMETYFAGPEGWGVISDIDDTIKVTLTSDPVGILRESFVSEPSPISGMPELYTEIKSLLPEDTAWFYLSASPYNLYPFLKQFRKQYYPSGTLILRDSSWRTMAGLLSALTLDTEEYKVDRMTKINSWLPRKKMIVVGDSTQSDPEAYGEIYRAFPGWIQLILIRKATDVAAVGIAEKNEPERFESAFEDIPKEAWHVFEDPRECVDIVKNAIARTETMTAS
ncbi:actin filament organization protein App1-like protein [Ophiocordyceps camponoti-floridani]|uniref:Actin filament organization protein App1-like protein n=1 Tax=Ophiocordyceps camponoti-floridani TaxID=2030778 RepID=A0A8H4VFU6_9HYPO|nr:actin filament organization protein App1-like protein [Ophiocordyceps camponoti-floridani]